MKKIIFIVLCTFVSLTSFAQTYTGSQGNNTSVEFITNVQFGSINNASDGSDADGDLIDGYDDYTSQTAVVGSGSTYTLSVTIDPDPTDYIYAWIDWNDNGDFTDLGEEYILASNVSASGPFSTSIIIPSTTVAINTRMRVSLKRGAAPTSTEAFAHGEVEDYSIYIDIDTDGDGVYNTEDLDADNDGILDTDENTCITQGFSNGNFENNLVTPTSYVITAQANVPGWETTASDGKIEIWHTNFNSVPAYEGTYFAEINANNILPQRLFQTLTVTPGDIVKWNVAHRGRAGLDRMDIMVGPSGAPVTQQIASTNNTAWQVYTSSYTVPDGVTEIEIGFEAVSTSGGNKSVGNFIDDVQLYITSTNYCDSDNDGVPNIYDMDADNDGIADVVEAGGTDPDNDGRIGTGAITDANGNGVDDSIDATPLSEPDTDSDGFLNYLDIDSDGDGIVDNVEAQTTSGYKEPSGNDNNNNGWDDLYEAGGEVGQIGLTNTDGDSFPDYLDLNSDNDGATDAIEGYDTNKDGIANKVLTRNDSDKDGLDDSFDSDDESKIDNGGPTNNGQTALTFPNDDNVSTNPIEDQDWREPLSSTLPVELISFKAIKNNNSVDLTWSTASEINNDYFLVQKSDDNVNFETIESVDGNGNSNVIINYFAIDNNPYSGVNYYRLLQVDYDGTQDYSNTITVNFIGENEIIVYPNPTTGIINIEGASNFQLMVYTPSAELLFNTKIENSNIYKLDLSNYSKGVYIIQLISDYKTEVKRIIVN